MTTAKMKATEKLSVKTLAEEMRDAKRELEHAKEMLAQSSAEVAKKAKLLDKASNKVNKKIAERIREHLKANNVAPPARRFVPENWYPLSEDERSNHLPRVYFNDLGQIVIASVGKADWVCVNPRDIYLPENLMLLALLEHLGIDLS